MAGTGKPQRLNESPLTAGTWFIDEPVDFSKSNVWTVKVISKGKKKKENHE